jgi:predicted methyltransferase
VSESTFSSGTWANIIAVAVLTAGFVKNCQETATLVASQEVVNTNQDRDIQRVRDEVTALQASSVQMEILQRVTAVETKVDGLVKSTEKKR